MNVSRVKRAVIGFWALGQAVVFAQGAWAQGAPMDLSAPVDLTPPSQNQPSAPMHEQRAPLPAPKAPPASGVQPGGLSGAPLGPGVIGSAVQSEALEQVNPDVAGALSEADGGFGPAMWWGTERAVIDNFLTRLPVTSSSPAMRDLMRRLLLTGGAVPEGGEPGTLITLRAGLLSAMGDFQGVHALLDAVPGYDSTPEMLRVELDTRLLTGDMARACDLAHGHIETQRSAYWQKAFNFCQAVEGRGEAAMLGLSMMDEMGVEDPVYSQLLRALVLNGEAPVVESLSDPTPLHLALARVARAKLPTDVIASNRPAVLRAIAISPNADAELRLEAAERAESAGALPTDALRQLYASISFTDDELKNPLTVAASRTGPMSRALLYRATMSQTVPLAQAEALSRALDLARVGGRYASTARAFLPQLSRLGASDDLAWFAPEAIRAFLITGRTEAAQPWFEVLNKAAVHDPEMARARERVMPVARLAGFQGADDWSMDRLSDWWAAAKDTPDARLQGATLVAALDALGEYVPDPMWVQMTEGPSHQSVLAPHPSIWFLMKGASTQARVGETVMLGLVTLGEGGPARADPIILHRVLTALRYIGLEDEARAMALEAVVAAGL